MSVYSENTQIDEKVAKLPRFSVFDRITFLFVISFPIMLAMFWNYQNIGKTIGYPQVKEVFKNKTGHSQGQLFLVTSKVYALLMRLLYS